ncbi:sensor histidine kinase [Actinocrinis puniceicyclus]|uniref:histidine kinase n=1 Tax=Actinocrinis puniceicyclus TaxID=977794 RepID=A0A8J8BDX2_9ACTN|nr:sensor histidine kinase [Actinocrinis puniceicyclus]MBS2964611.1 sensor histidine kinase [Actinocrinis puniceicyclus]
MLRSYGAAKAVASKAVTAIPGDVLDLAIAVAVTFVALTSAAISYPPSGPRRFDVLAVAVTTAIGAALVLRRRFPLSVMAVCAALVAAYEARGYWLSLNQTALQLAFFTVASRGARRWAVAAAATTFPLLMYSNAHEWTGPLFDICLGTAARVLIIGIVADGARRLRESSNGKGQALTAEHNGQLQRLQRDREQRAVLLERIRIARELHDVTAHHLSVIAVQAGLARYVLGTDMETADHALRTISEVGSEGLAELRRLISLLRPDEDEAAGAGADDRPAPGIAQLPVLIERVGLSGTPSRYTVAGRQRPLPAGIELCVYRVVQESLTNVLKHAPGSSVDVRLEYEPERIRVAIVDSGPHSVALQRSRTPRSVVAQSTDHSGAGVGLTGMRERAALYGGELSAGRNPDGGFEVTLTLPLDSAAAHEIDAHPPQETPVGVERISHR